VKINLWYARDQDLARYEWAANITHEHQQAHIYGSRLNWSFIKYCLTHPDEIFVIVGWMNNNTRLIHLLFFLFRRPYNHWTDLPSSVIRDVGMQKKIRRWIAYKVLQYSNSKVFGVGSIAINYLRERGFVESKLINLPIFVDSNEDLPAFHSQREGLLEKYKIQDGDFLLTGGSRINREKGYDILIKAVGLLDVSIRQYIKVIIIGNGDAVPRLESLIDKLNLRKTIILEKWLAIEDFKTLIANSDVFIHPARMDSFGGTILGMALGVPVIGSFGAGAAVERIEHGRNGFLYDAEDVHSLANYITLLYQSPDLRKRMGEEALKTAREWPPERGAKIMIDHII